MDVNRSPNHLHGGITGFGKSIWDFETDEKENSITFSIKSDEGDGGYPGNVNVKAKYKLAGKKLIIEISGTVDRETPLNMGQHNYFNLCSPTEESYDICNHLLYLNADSFTETDQNLIPTGKILSTEGTKMHFYEKKKIGNISLDDNFILNTGHTLDNPAAELVNPYNDLSLKLWTDQPGVQVYNASKLDLNQRGFQQGQQARQQDLANQMGISQLQSGLGARAQDFSRAQISGLGTLGAAQQAQSQAVLDAQRQAAQMAIEEPRQGLARFGQGIAAITPGAGTVSFGETPAAAQSSPLATALGLGLAGADIYGRLFPRSG